MIIAQIKNLINVKRLNTSSFLRKVRLRLTIDKHQVSHLEPTIKCKKKWYGSSYGGFYVNPTLLNEKSVVYSFGIGKDITFDVGIINDFKCHVYGFDPTPKSVEFIQKNSPNQFFHFHEYGISNKSGIERFYLPINTKAVSASMTANQFVNKDNFIDVKMKSFDDITNDLKHSHIDVLKMDIEGSEYEVLETIIHSKVTVTQLIVEFHDRFFEGDIRSKRIVEYLNQNGFEIFAASLNFEEISFINTRLL